MDDQIQDICGKCCSDGWDGAHDVNSEYVNSVFKWISKNYDIVSRNEDHDFDTTQNACDECCDKVKINYQYIGQVFQWLLDNDYSLVKK